MVRTRSAAGQQQLAEAGLGAGVNGLGVDMLPDVVEIDQPVEKLGVLLKP